VIDRRVILLAALAAPACTPLLVQQPALPGATFAGPRLEPDWFVSFDGARLGLSRWETQSEPWAVIVGLHGMNDYANAFHLAAPFWAGAGVATYAYDQRGFGRSPNRGVWGGEALMTEDLRTFVALVRARHPNARIVVVAESMGGAVATLAFASDRPPAAERLILMAPAVWGWSNQPLPYRTALWFAARLTGAHVYEPPRWVTNRVRPSDNIPELIAMGRDRLMIWGARSDTLYGLVQTMERAWRSTGRIQVPVLYLYGANDQIIPKRPSLQAAARLKPTDRTAYYTAGWHLLMRDLQAPVVWRDVLSYLRDPSAPLPSNAPAIPRPEAARVGERTADARRSSEKATTP
jgi:acylglycerol lipase